MIGTSRAVRDWLRRGSYPSARKVLYPNNPLIGGLFTLNPWMVFAAVLIFSLLILAVPSYILRLASLTTGAGPRAGENVGFMHRPNWGPLYLSVIPAIFALASLASRRLKRSLLRLLRPPTAIQRSSGNRYHGYLQDFTQRTITPTRHLFVICLLLAATLALFADHHNFIGYTRVFLHTAQPPYWDEFDWMNASQIPSAYHPNVQVYSIPNALFFVVAIAFEGAAICLGLFWVSAFWIHARVFADLMLRTPDYTFVPWEKDPDRRLGLKPIGFVYSTFLLISILFLTFVYYHRLQILGIPLWNYFSNVFSAYGKFDYKQPLSTLPEAIRAVWALNCFNRINAGMKALLVAGPLLSLTIAWWPIFRLGTFVNDYRERLVRRLRAENQNAVDAGHIEQARLLTEKIQALEQASVWPNGYAVGWAAFAFMIILELSAVFPPLFPLLIFSGGAARIAKYFFAKK